MEQTIEQQRADLVARIEVLRAEWSAALERGAGGHSIHAHVAFVALNTARIALDVLNHEVGAA